MNVFAALFGIFRQKGLVLTLREGKSVFGFAVSAFVLSVLGGMLYGLAMGIGLGPETALKDSIKIGLIIILALLIAFPIFWLTYRLLGREESRGQVAAVPLTFVTTATFILAVTSPLVFILSLLAGLSPEAVYIHVVIVDLALLVGLYLAGTLVSQSFVKDRSRLVVPNVVGFLMLGVILVVLTLFFSPFLRLSPTFSRGTDLLNDRLGIGVADKATNALSASRSADQVTYHYQTSNLNGDLERDYTVTRIGDNYLIEIHLHAVPGQAALNNKRIWIVNGRSYNDLTEGPIRESDGAALADIYAPSLPENAFQLSDEFSGGSWRAFEAGNTYYIFGTSSTLAQVSLVLDADTLRLTNLTIGNANESLRDEIRVSDFARADLDQAGLEASLQRAVVLASIDRSDASMQDYVQEQELFAVRLPRTWSAGSWNPTQRVVEFSNPCGVVEGCPGFKILVFDLAEGKGAKEFADELAASLNRQPQYREVQTSTRTIDDLEVGVVEYLYDRTVKGQIETTHHIEYIFAGSIRQYHLDFHSPELHFEENRALFDSIAQQFEYLKNSP